MNERRTDQETRDRLNELDEKLSKRLKEIETGYIQRADQNQNRLRRHGRGMIVFAVVIAALLLAIGVWDIHIQTKTNNNSRGVKALTHQNTARINDIQTSRKTSLSIICGFESATIEAGRFAVLAGATQPTPPKFEKFLESEGFPPLVQRVKQARKLARAYGKEIGTEIEKVAGRRGAGIVKPNGSVDCKKFQQVILQPKG